MRKKKWCVRDMGLSAGDHKGFVCSDQGGDFGFPPPTVGSGSHL